VKLFLKDEIKQNNLKPRIEGRISPRQLEVDLAMQVKCFGIFAVILGKTRL